MPCLCFAGVTLPLSATLVSVYVCKFVGVRVLVWVLLLLKLFKPFPGGIGGNAPRLRLKMLPMALKYTRKNAARYF